VPYAEVNGLRLDYEVRGAGQAPPLLLIMGLGMPAAMWPDEFVTTLLDRGFRVITFDNRDCGGSSRLTGLPVPNIPRAIVRALLRRKVSASYELRDMALDAAGVLDAAGIARAHVVGVSMGGMIAQVLAALQPERVLSLTSIMSSTGNPRPKVALGKPRALRALLRRPPDDPADIDGIVDHLMYLFGIIGSPGFVQDAAVLRPHLERVARRGLYPEGTARQLGAILASGDRRALLKQVTAPTLVIHGASDPLVPVAAGRDTAQHIRDARLEVVAGMGHDFPPALMTRIAAWIADHCASGERQGEPEAAADAGLARDPDLPAHRLDQAARDGEAEAGALADPAGRRRDALEGPEQPGLVLGGDADARIVDRDADAIPVDLRDQADAAPVGELEGVRK
jgi:pimeloyl-ACP methyl ester carboxylesterase